MASWLVSVFVSQVVTAPAKDKTRDQNCAFNACSISLAVGGRARTERAVREISVAIQKSFRKAAIQTAMLA
jgi:hypothetical protein